LKIDQNLFLIIPVDVDTGTLYVHAAAPGREVFERYFRVVARAFGEIQEMTGSMTGPRVAMLTIRACAAEMGPGVVKEVEDGLIGEIKRLANVAVPDKGRWDQVPLEEAVARGLIDETDASEVENALAFFMLGCSMYPKALKRGALTAVMQTWGARIESSDFTAFVDSLPTSTAPASSGVKVVSSARS